MFQLFWAHGGGWNFQHWCINVQAVHCLRFDSLNPLEHKLAIIRILKPLPTTTPTHPFAFGSASFEIFLSVSCSDFCRKSTSHSS